MKSELGVTKNRKIHSIFHQSRRKSSSEKIAVLELGCSYKPLKTHKNIIFKQITKKANFLFLSDNF